MNVELASKIVSLRPALESLIVRCTQQPAELLNRSPMIEQFSHLIHLLSDQQLEHVLCQSTEEEKNPPTNNIDSRPLYRGNFPSHPYPYQR